jgi:hypothetical protein
MDFVTVSLLMEKALRIRVCFAQYFAPTAKIAFINCMDVHGVLQITGLIPMETVSTVPLSSPIVLHVPPTVAVLNALQIIGLLQVVHVSSAPACTQIAKFVTLLMVDALNVISGSVQHHLAIVLLAILRIQIAVNAFQTLQVALHVWLFFGSILTMSALTVKLFTPCVLHVPLLTVHA